MKRIKSIGIILFAFLIISQFFSFASQVDEVAEVVQDLDSQFLNKIVLCRNVQENEPVFQTNAFRTWDDKAVAWISFNYQSEEPFMLTWEWIDPTGRIYHVGEIEMDSGNYPDYRSWYWISIWEHHAARLLGDWQVKVYIDEHLVAFEEFSIE